MNTSVFRLLAAVLTLSFLVAACASNSGVAWTFAPTVTSESGEAGEAPVEEPVTDVEAGDADSDELPAGEGDATPDTSEAPVDASQGEAPAEAPASDAPAEAPASEAPSEPAESDAPTEPAASEPAAIASTGEPRIIELQADNALRFTDLDGQKVEDIPVVPGETVVFRVNNTAGFAHNMYIGQDAELSVMSATTDVGIPDWTTGVQELTWTVPDDIEGLKFGCTVPGHYSAMQGTFSVADGGSDASTPQEPVEPAAEAPAASMAPMASMAAPAESHAPEATESAAPQAGTAVTADARVIDLDANAALQFTQNGERVLDIPVTPGEHVVIRVDNTAGFAHNFWIGTDEQLSGINASTDVGIPDWNTGVQFVEWEVPADITGLKFGCTVPAHYTLMQGTFSVSR